MRIILNHCYFVVVVNTGGGNASTGLSSDAVHTGVGGKLLKCPKLRFREAGVEEYQGKHKNASESV